MSNVVSYLGLSISFKASAALSLFSLVLLLLSGSLFFSGVLAAIFVAAFALLSVSALPLALENAGFYQKVLCVGIFFSGVELPNGVLEVFLGA
jgi:hypothetical protein